MKKLVLLLLVSLAASFTAYAADPAILLFKPRLKPGQQLSEFVQFYLNPTPVQKGSKVHDLYVYTGQSEISGNVAITIVDDGGVLFQTSDLMQGSYKNLGLAVIRIELDREISENLKSVKLSSVRAQARLITNPTGRL